VPFNAAPPLLGPQSDMPERSRAPALALAGLSAGAAAAAVVSGFLAVDAYGEFRAEQRERQAQELRTDVTTYRNIALIAGGVSVAAGVGAWLTWPVAPQTRLALGGRGFSLSREW
jgi:hypothetical protein